MMFARLIDALSERSIKTMALLLVIFLFALPVLAFLWITAVPGHSHTGPLPPLSVGQVRLANSLRADVTAIASKPHNMRHPEALEDAARYIEHALGAAGYVVKRQPFRVGDQFVRNIEAMIEPASMHAPTLVIGAHYDSAGDAPGANDNGTGVAAVLALARTMASLRGKSAIRVRLVFFTNEEPPFFQTPQMGSFVYARALSQSGENVMGMMSLETLGYYRDEPGSQHYPSPLGMRYPNKGNFIAFVGLTSSRSFVRRTVAAFRAVAPFPSVGGTAPGFVQGIGWSDHWSFARFGIPALMVTDTAPFRYPYYHSTADTPDKIDYERLARVVSGLERTIRSWARNPS